MLERADDEILARRKALSDRVFEELTAAGLPAVLANGQGRSLLAPGAQIVVDELADAGGGVWVRWETHFVLRADAKEALSADRKDDQVIRLAGAAANAMQAAIAGILAAAGHEVAKDANDMSPFT